MRTSIFLGLALALPVMVLATATNQALNVNTGLWQVTATNNMGGSQHTISYKKCVTANDLTTNPWANGPDEKCTWTVVTSTSSDLEIQGTSCAAGKNYGMDTSVDVKIHAIDSQDVTASLSGTSTGNGQTMNFSGSYKGKWLSASCPTGTE
jgi:hypothetical protein